MDHDKYIELMSAAIDGELTAGGRRELDSHLAACPQCAELFRTLSANARAARELDCQVPAGLKERIMGSLPPQEVPAEQDRVIRWDVKKGRSRRWKRWAPLAAAACLALVVVMIPRGGSSEAPNAAEPKEMAPGTYGGSTADAIPDSPERSASPQAAGSRDGNSSDSLSGYSSTVVTESDFPAAPAHYAFENQRSIRVDYGATPEPGAVVIGSVEALADYLAGFESLTWDGEGNTVPIAELEELAETYTAGFFEKNRLLCVVIESGSGSNRCELAPQGLLRDRVTVLAHIPEAGTCDMAAWLIVAEVDTMFEDGDILTVEITH